MSEEKIINNQTKGHHLTAELLFRSENWDTSDWVISTTEDIPIEDGSVARVLPAGTTFRYVGALDATAEDVLDEVSTRGMLSACETTLADFEGELEERLPEEL